MTKAVKENDFTGEYVRESFTYGMNDIYRQIMNFFNNIYSFLPYIDYEKKNTDIREALGVFNNNPIAGILRDSNSVYYYYPYSSEIAAVLDTFKETAVSIGIFTLSEFENEINKCLKKEDIELIYKIFHSTYYRGSITNFFNNFLFGSGYSKQMEIYGTTYYYVNTLTMGSIETSCENIINSMGMATEDEFINEVNKKLDNSYMSWLDSQLENAYKNKFLLNLLTPNIAEEIVLSQQSKSDEPEPLLILYRALNPDPKPTNFITREISLD